MPKGLTVGVNTHGHCFDGLASAVVFTRLVEKLRPNERLAFSYRSCGYGPKMSAVPAEWLTSDLNAILDFRYTESPKLTYYFDHHATGFASDEERAHAEAAVERSRGSEGAHARMLHFDAAYGSCTKLIADVARDTFGVHLAGLDDLVAWADRIDAARFDTAAEALGDTPAQRLAQIVEHHGDGDFLTRVVPMLGRQELSELARSTEMERLYSPIAAARDAFKKRVKEKGREIGDVVFVDLSEETVAPAGKFVTYALFPSALYSVSLQRTKQLYKLSVGFNPWCGRPRKHDIASICRREGGGGHPVVGAATFPLDRHAEARAAALRVVRDLGA